MNIVRCAQFLIAITLIGANPSYVLAKSTYEGSIDHKQDANWRKVVDKAARLSTMQNHGHADLTHTCYAQDNKAFCATVVSYNSVGHLTFVRVIRRGEDNSVYARDVCQFNPAKTLRTCVDFDTGYKSLWAPDKSGDWKLVASEQSDDEAASGGL